MEFSTATAQAPAVRADAIAVGVFADGELTQGTKRGTLSQLTDWTAWADKALVF